MTAALIDKRLLVVEDEYMLADDLARALSAAGAEVIGPFPNENLALTWMDRGGRIDGAVLDINLDGQISVAVAERLIADNVPFVLATGYGQAAVDPRFAEVPRWEKPYDARELAGALSAELFDHLSRT